MLRVAITFAAVILSTHAFSHSVTRFNCFVDEAALILKIKGVDYPANYMTIDHRNICQRTRLAAQAEDSITVYWQKEVSGATTPRQGRSRLVEACLERASVVSDYNIDTYGQIEYCTAHRLGYTLHATTKMPVTLVRSAEAAAIVNEAQRYTNNLAICSDLIATKAVCESYEASE